MTGRGGAAAPAPRPVTPADPTLEQRPVPRDRSLSVLSFGPGADSHVRENIIPWVSLRELAVQASASPTDDTLRLLEEIEGAKNVTWREDEYVDVDPTWGFYVFVTAYEPDQLENLPIAVKKWVDIQCRQIQQNALLPPGLPVAVTAEAVKRFKLDIVTDKDALKHASDDRIREEFRALIRSKALSDDEDFFPGPARNHACFVLDSSAIDMLMEIDETNQDWSYLVEKKLKLIDIHWERPQTPADPYRGVGRCALNELVRLYLMITSFGTRGVITGDL